MKAFICYSHSDHDTKCRFLELMEAEAATVGDTGWIWNDGKIEGGQRWDSQIRDALEIAKIGFVLLSPSLFAGDYPMMIELPTLLAKARAKKARIIPIICDDVQQCLKLFTSRFGRAHEPQMEPMIAGRLHSFVSLTLDEQAEACRRMHAQARAYLLHLTEGLPVRDPIHILGNPQRCTEEAEKLALLYPAMPHDVMVQVVECYLKLWTASQLSHATAFVTGFAEKMTEWKITFKSDDHVDVCNLLKMGLPREPTHLQIIDSTEQSAERLVGCDKFAALLIGIRLTESRNQSDGYASAREHFNGLQNRDHRFHQCALLQYALGQCSRKLDQLAIAEPRLQQAIHTVEEWADRRGCCSDGACPKGSLLVESVRGLGAVYRKRGAKSDDDGQPADAKKYWRKAEGEFRRGNGCLRDFPHDIPNRIRADFLYSYGYFEFERLVRLMKHPFRNPSKFRRKGLISAIKGLEECFRLDRNFIAPLARMAIINLVLGHTKAAVEQMIQARVRCQDAKGAEVRLTKFMCGFGALLFSTRVGLQAETRSWTGEDIYLELQRLLEEIEVPLAARQCHYFDTKVLIGPESLRGDTWLTKAFALLEKSSRQ